LKGETDAFVTVAERRVQPLNMGVNRTFFQYQTLSGVGTDESFSGSDIYEAPLAGLAVADGVVGTPQAIGQLKTSPAALGEWKN
jgi:hypothetical protein